MEKTNRISHYYEGISGCRLAVDIYFPETVVLQEGRISYWKEKLPLIVKGGYDQRRAVYEFEPHAIDGFTNAGFVVAIVEQRGVGASFGSNAGFYTRLDARDVVQIIDTLAAEEWCNGKVGMYGGSNKGMIQLLTMAEYAKLHENENAEDRSWHLKAVIPGDANANFYYQNYPNGASSFPAGVKAQEQELGVPVDEDIAPDYPLAHSAMKEHCYNGAFLSQYLPNMYRDSMNHELGYAPNLEIPAWSDMDDIKYSGIAIYQNGGWYDPGCTGEILAYKRWGGRLLLGPWVHYELYEGGGKEQDGTYDWVQDYVNFFEETLTDKEHDIKNQPPIRYYMRNAGEGKNWRFAADFPLDGQANTYFYLDAGKADGIEWAGEDILPGGKRRQIRHGIMNGNIPDTAWTEYVHREVDVYGSMGRMARRIEKDMTQADSYAVTFTGPVLENPVELAGVPVVSLYVTSTFQDGNFIAILEEVTSDGISHFITDGYIRASHAKTMPEEAWDSMGLPYHRGYAEDMVKLSQDVPTELIFNMEAAAYRMKKGSRLRISIMTGAGDSFHAPEGFPKAPTITLYTGKDYASYVRIPVIKPCVNRFEGEWRGVSYDGQATVYTFQRGVYVNYGIPETTCEKEACRNRGRWLFFPNKQVFEQEGKTCYETEDFTAWKDKDKLSIESPEYVFHGIGEMPDTVSLWEDSEYVGKIIPESVLESRKKWIKRSADYKDIKVANVPVKSGRKGFLNPQPYSNMNLLLDVLLPHEGISEIDWECFSEEDKERFHSGKKYPCIVYVHGFGMDNHARELIIPELLAEGYGVACVDYRVYPPNVWPAPMHDVKGAIRYLKANAERFHLDQERFGIMGCSCGGYLASLIAATNGESATEGRIGGNLSVDSSVKAATIYFPWTDAFTFGEENSVKYPGEPDRVEMSDGPFAPIGCIIDFAGPGKGMGELKRHRLDSDPYYRSLWQRAVEASPVSHVTEKSAPSVFIHGNFECGIAIPMEQSIDMFNALTRKGVKSLVFLNNGCVYGEDPEVKAAVIAFIKNRV